MSGLFEGLGGSGILSIILLILGIIILFSGISNNMRLNRLERRYKMFMKGAEGQTLEKSFARKFNQIDRLFEAKGDHDQEIAALKNNLGVVFSKYGIEKYDAFDDVGGKLSFAIAMLDRNNTGIVLNAVHSRDNCFLYLKEIVKGESYVMLSGEEVEALRKAVNFGYGELEQLILETERSNEASRQNNAKDVKKEIKRDRKDSRRGTKEDNTRDKAKDNTRKRARDNTKDRARDNIRDKAEDSSRAGIRDNTVDNTKESRLNGRINNPSGIYNPEGGYDPSDKYNLSGAYNRSDTYNPEGTYKSESAFDPSGSFNPAGPYDLEDTSYNESGTYDPSRTYIDDQINDRMDGQMDTLMQTDEDMNNL